ncbi:MAG: hypothetical protein A2840_02495 [Candidatus Buchananbacteria bacterium RIFCSPHIGHO2_01_FULL_47_11b]|uniref:Glycosyltransferase RgtA/B/C/D-like domain-containing protein n=1 Tax=Candidatus Buchananbacteria bacterium RIFCSPHIGHO2_01_FULL_47_11b TaxID=1797537 RepID=A0A1G1Y1I0_9BACT|nr:MAG: hypothetical protein A2840_02495 [Candidatus Buchananbacteria bacterium RIFCSPHIGHO2_01_FULL_47_11b]
MKYWKIFLVLILLLAVFLRLYKITSVPPSLYWEEAALGYDAYSIMQTGKDYHGNTLPILAFPSFGDYKPSGYFYAIVPFMRVFGLSELAVRLPSVFAGIATVFVIYAIGSTLYNKKIGIFAALFYAVQPWSIQLSRVGFETNLATFLLAMGVLLSIKAEKKTWLYAVSALFFGLSAYTYHSERIVAPLFGLVIGTRFLFSYIRSPKKGKPSLSWAVCALFIGIAMLFPILINLKNPIIAHRAEETSIFSDPAPVLESNALRAEDGNTVVSRVLHHRYVLFGELMFQQYVKNFSPTFLFLTGDENNRHGTHEFGLLYHVEFFLVAAGLYIVCVRRTFRHMLPVMWIAFSALPVALTVTSPHTLRFASAAPAFALLSALGIVFLSEVFWKIWRKKLILGILAILCIESVVYLHFYFTHYPVLSATDWQYGYKDLFSSLEQLKKPNQKVFVTREQGRPSIYYMFYTKQDPRYVQSQDAVVKKDQQEFLELGRYVFVDNIPPEKGTLVASSPSKMPKNVQPIRTILNPDGTISWVIWEQQ